MLAVADGVGGWNRKGVDPGIFSRELCSNVWQHYLHLRRQGKKTTEISVKDLLIEGVKKTKAIGTSTFVMALMDEKEMVVKGLNLGDSGYMIVRPELNSENGLKTMYRSKE